MSDWATRFSVVEFVRGEPRARLVLAVIEADSAADAARETGLVGEDWHLASDRDLSEWDDLVDSELEEADIEVLDKAAARAQRAVGQRRKNAKPGREIVAAWDLWRAWRITLARARLQEQPSEAKEEEAA